MKQERGDRKSEEATREDSAVGETGRDNQVSRRDVFGKLIWVAPAIVATATVKARAATGSCDPTCDPNQGCRPG